jgi:TonB family protein
LGLTGGVGTLHRGVGDWGGLELGGPGRDHAPRIDPGRTTVVGALDREEIERVIRRHQNEIRFCYSTELTRAPGLAGKLSVSFTIDASGAVTDAAAAENTTGNPALEQCFLSRIRHWRFPEPKGGGVVVVTYPWVLAPAGGE